MESQHRDQVPSRHMCHIQGFFTYPGASRVAGLWSLRVPEGEQGPRMRWGARNTVMRTRKLLANNPKRLSLQTL